MLQRNFKISVAATLLLAATLFLRAQNPLAIPPLLTGDTIDLDIQSGTQVFYPPIATPTFGINGTWMAPTIAVNKGDSVLLRVTNHLNTSTTIHWHGLHVPAHADGGPHQPISVGATWDPAFKILNPAGTYWYHPHGEGKTDRHVSKGIAGFFLVHDSSESSLGLPMTYGVDDFPVVVQSKAFDVLQQIAVATNNDTAIFVNGTLHPYLDAPAQVVRLRLLNGSSMRSYIFGFQGDMPFSIIAGDGGLRDSVLTATRIRMSPGERVDILLDLSGLQGQTVTLRNFGSALHTGIYGSAVVGIGPAMIPDYALNPLNGLDYDILPIHVVAPTANPVTSLPTALVPAQVYDTTTLAAVRTLMLSPMLPNDSSTLAEGPFGINGVQFSMDSINITTYLGNVERWHLVNTTLVAHPFHIHDMQFDVVAVNGGPVPAFLKGRKDVVLVMAGESVDFVTRFEDFADPMVPYMYHCHLLHHEDEGMMGSFLVLDTVGVGVDAFDLSHISVKAYPNPSAAGFTLQYEGAATITSASVVNALGQKQDLPALIGRGGHFETALELGEGARGIYLLRLVAGGRAVSMALVRQ
jgi:blue copper oxidase